MEGGQVGALFALLLLAGILQPAAMVCLFRRRAHRVVRRRSWVLVLTSALAGWLALGTILLRHVTALPCALDVLVTFAFVPACFLP